LLKLILPPWAACLAHGVWGWRALFLQGPACDARAPALPCDKGLMAGGLALQKFEENSKRRISATLQRAAKMAKMPPAPNTLNGSNELHEGTFDTPKGAAAAFMEHERPSAVGGGGQWAGSA
jgi:hypothetical protein